MSLHVVLPVATGIVLILIALPLLLRWIGPNRLYGLRVPATFADEWVWYEANAKSGRDMVIVGITLIILPFALQAIPIIRPTAHLALVAMATVTGIVIVAIVGWRRANRLLEQRRRT
jgi:uncharacterized membrane protein